jgi:hypothetical protein
MLSAQNDFADGGAGRLLIANTWVECRHAKVD